MSFKDRLKKPSLSALKAKAEANFSENRKSFDDDNDPRIWKPTFGPDGKAVAKIRFLPTKGEDGRDFVTKYRYSFKINGQWYIEDSLKTMGDNVPDPCADWTYPMVKQDLEFLKKHGINYRTTYLANILVVHDEANPENNGKVFLYEYASTVNKKIRDLMFPEIEDDEPLDPFHYTEGCNFNIVVKQAKKGAANDYTGCKFDLRSIGPVNGLDEDGMEKIWEQSYDISKEIAPEKFKSYQELEARFKKVMGEHWYQPFNSETTKDTTAGQLREEEGTDEEKSVEEVAKEEKVTVESSQSVNDLMAKIKASRGQ